MVAGQARSRARVFLAVLVLTLSAFGWRVLSLGMADQLARELPFKALGWRANHPGALVRAAEQSVAQQPAEARELALAALRADPLEGRAYRVLGQLAEAAGDERQAVRLFALAATRSPRDLPTHLWLEQHYLRAGKLVPALRHVDLSLRVQPQTQAVQYPLLTRLAAVPQAQADLGQLLARRPPWRENFVSTLCRDAPDSVAITPLMNQLRLAPGGLSAGELAAWLERLGRDQRWAEAYLTWAAALPVVQQSGLGNLFNGGFESDPSNSGFDWRFERVPGAYIERLPGAGVIGSYALRISFEERRVPFHHVRQLMALPPGRYRLEGRARADGLRSERGLVWSVLCLDHGNAVASTTPLSGNTPWRPFSVSFELPAGSCGGQWLQLDVPARIAAEQRIGGRAWFDDLRIVREKRSPL